MFEWLVVRMLTVLGVFFSGGGAQVECSEPVVQLRRGRIAVSCVLLNPFSEDLLNVIDSGTPVTLTFICRLRNADGSPAFVPDTTVPHRVVKDLATSVYEVTLGTRTLLAERFTEYSQFFRLETVALWPVDGARDAAPYYVEVSAKLEPMQIHATGQAYDLMALWNYRVPRKRSATFTRRLLEERRVTP